MLEVISNVNNVIDKYSVKLKEKDCLTIINKRELIL